MAEFDGNRGGHMKHYAEQMDRGRRTGDDRSYGSIVQLIGCMAELSFMLLQRKLTSGGKELAHALFIVISAKVAPSQATRRQISL